MPFISIFKGFYGVTNATRDNGGSSNYEEKNNGMKVYSYVYTSVGIFPGTFPFSSPGTFGLL